jgi:hypothetical protein
VAARPLDVEEDQVSDEQVLEAARAIRPYLAELVGPDADRLDGELAALLARSRDGGDAEVQGLILDCLMRNPATHDWAASFLIDQRPADADAWQRGYGSLGGEGEVVAALRFACPVGGDTVWYRRSVGQKPPICATHRLALQPTPGR